MAIFGVKSVSLGQIGGQNSLFLTKMGDLFDFLRFREMAILRSEYSALNSLLFTSYWSPVDIHHVDNLNYG